MVLLDAVAAAYTEGLVSRLGDQLFCVVLLVGFAIYSLRRQKLIEDKLEKYMAEDREEMKEIIQNNTEAFKMFNNKVIKLSVLLILVSSGCNSVKKTSRIERSDSLVINNSSAIKQTTFSSKETEKKDTVFGVPKKTLSATLSGDDLKPVFNEKGVAKPNKKMISGKGLSIDATANPDGSIVITANCDSITFLVSGLIREKVQIQNNYDSVVALQSKQRQSQTIQESKVVKKPFSWLVFALGFSTGAACIWLTKKLQLPKLILSKITGK